MSSPSLFELEHSAVYYSFSCCFCWLVDTFVHIWIDQICWKERDMLWATAAKGYPVAVDWICICGAGGDCLQFHQKSESIIIMSYQTLWKHIYFHKLCFRIILLENHDQRATKSIDKWCHLIQLPLSSLNQQTFVCKCIINILVDDSNHFNVY